MSDSLRRIKLSAVSATSVPALRSFPPVNGFFVALSRNVRAPVASRIAVAREGNCIRLCTWCRAKRENFAISVSQKPGSNAFAKPLTTIT